MPATACRSLTSIRATSFANPSPPSISPPLCDKCSTHRLSLRKVSAIELHRGRSGLSRRCSGLVHQFVDPHIVPHNLRPACRGVTHVHVQKVAVVHADATCCELWYTQGQ